MAGVFTRRHSTFNIITPARTFPIPPGPGDVAVSELEEGLVEALPILNQGAFLELVEGDDMFPTISFTAFMDGTPVGPAIQSLLNAVMRLGAFAADAFTDPGAVVWTADLEWVLTRGGVTATFYFHNCRMKVAWGLAKEGNLFQFSATAYGDGVSRLTIS